MTPLVEGSEIEAFTDPGKSLLERMTDAYALCSNQPYRHYLKNIIDDLWIEIEDFHKEPTDIALRDLNGLWALAERVLAACPPEGTPDPVSGDNEPARLAA